MEYMEGQLLQDSHLAGNPRTIQRLHDAVQVLHKLKTHGFEVGQVGGISSGFPWGSSTVKVGTLDLLKECIRQRLSRSSRGQRFVMNDWTEPTFCHMDLAPRNIMVTEDKVVVLDWATLAVYPKEFEVAALCYEGSKEPPERRVYYTELKRLLTRDIVIQQNVVALQIVAEY